MITQRKVRPLRTALLLPAVSIGLAGLAALPAASVQAAPAKHRPPAAGQAAPYSGKAVAGLTGSAAKAAAGDAADRFEELTRNRTRELGQDEVAAETLHTDWGVIVQNNRGNGMQVTQSVIPNVGNTRGGAYVYAPTALAPGKACMEITTAYTPSGPQVWAWDWCGGRSGVGKSVALNSSFFNTYTTVVNGRSAYTVKVEQTNASANSWTSYLWNYSSGAFDTFYTSSGSWDLDPEGYTIGWNIFEIYSDVDSGTGNGYYCAQFNNQSFESTSGQIRTNGSWVPLTSSNSSLSSSSPPSGSSFQCPSLSFSLTHANDAWIAKIGTGGSTTTRTTTTSSRTTTTTTTSRATTSSTSSTSSTTRTTTTTGGGGGSGTCSAAYKTVGSWGGGFQGEVAVTAGSAAISGWAVTVTWPSGQSITQLWGGNLSGTSSSQVVTNASWNGGLAAGASTTFGFIGSGNAASPTLSCTRA